VQVYNPAANTWALSTPLPEALSGAAMGTDSLGRLIVMGGMDVNGYDTADVWRSQALNAADAAPVLTTLPATNGIYLQPYVSSLNATGSPPPVYQLVSGPSGMTVDYYTGAINWTPTGLAQIGTIPVTMQASNYAGSTNYTFSITVPNPPPASVTNLTVVSATESSVTLSWSPEDAIYGPVTYSVWLRHVAHSPKGSLVTITYSQIGSATTGTSVTIGGLAAGLSQSYYVKATGPGGASDYVGVAASTLPAPPPTNFHVTGLTSATISLAWDAPVGGLPIASYEIIGWFNGIAAQYPLGYANIPGTTLTISGLAPGTAMLWGVSVKDTYGNVSAYTYLPSLVVNPAPSAQQMSTAVTPLTGAGGVQISVSLGDSALQTVLIQATTNPGDPNSWVQIGSMFPTTNSFIFVDTNAAQFPARYYRVVAP
jgi:hypothetical protein